MNPISKIILPHSGYKSLIVYKKSEIIYQGTVLFCRRFLPIYGDRTVDQMTQAARSCKQNIAEGSAAAATSLETQLKLTNVARATLDELLEDYQDYLKAHGYYEWEMENVKKIAAREYAKNHAEWNEWKVFFETRPADTLCNLMIVLIQQNRYLLDNMLRWQEQDFTEHGGVRERMHTVRIAERSESLNKCIYDRLNGAQTSLELDTLANDIYEYLLRTVWSIKLRKGWD